MLSGIWMLLLLLTACSSSSTDEEPQTPQKPKEKPVLKIYLFAPESPIITRANTGSVDAEEAERAIHTIDVWVFEHESPNDKVSYIHLDDVSFTGQKEIAMDITNEFANRPQKPRVDIYVAVNKESCGLATGENALGESTTLAQLKEAYIGTEYFGVSSLQSEVPTTGLPMSGLLENQIISGIAPVYTAMANNVKLVRAVSKVRFIFSKSSTGAPTITNLSISLNANVLPQQEYLFLEGIYPTYKSHVKSTGDNDYEPATTLVQGQENVEPAINSCANPASYAYTTETGQEYETKINKGLTIQDGQTSPDLSQLGLFYFRESHRQLAGTISYKIGDTNKTKPFTMASAGDFTRNHTWIVYGYFLGSGELTLNVVDVKSWTEDASNPKVYNW
jgi:hypothetical protein